MPKKQVIRDWHGVQNYLQKRLHQQNVQVVSLDIFDTLLARIDTPEQVQKAVCRSLAAHLGKPFTAEQIWEVRQSSERALREQAHAQQLDYECRYSDLLPIWLGQLLAEKEEGVSQELLAFTQATELALEQQALYVKAGVVEFLVWLCAQNVTLYAISDMYLDSQLLNKLLENKDLAKYFTTVFSSADHLLCKYSGRLFTHLAQQQNILPAHWVHIGDNPVSDRKAACQVGIQGVWLYEKAELRHRERQQLDVQMAQRGSIWKGQYFFSVVQQSLRVRAHETVKRTDRHTVDDFYYRYGRDVLGGAFSTFTLGLQERLQRKPVDKLFFVARDGYLFQQLYRKLATKQTDEYIYLSRKVITAASVAHGLTHEQALVAFYNPKQQGLHSVCKVYGLPEAQLQPLALQHGFNDFAEPIHDWHDPRLLAFLENEAVQACIRPVGQQHRVLLERYLEQVGFFGIQSAALVDIGWNGTVQKFLKQAFGGRADFPVVQGYYFAFVPKMYQDFGSQNFCEGIIHDSRRDNACERIPAEFEEIFEQGARAQGATTVAYRQNPQGCIEPVLKTETAPDRRAEQACNPMVAAIQRGVMDHWRHFLIAQQLTGYSSQDLLAYVYGQLERAVVYPTREETRMLTRLVHTEDFGDDHVLDLGQQALGWRDFLQPLKLTSKLRESAWRYALLDRVPTGISNFALRMVYLHAVKK